MVDPTEDNMLKITGDGRKAALDMHLRGGPALREARTATAFSGQYGFDAATLADRALDLVQRSRWTR